MPKKAWFFKNKTVMGMLGVMLVFAMFATGCPNGTTDPPEPTPPKTWTVSFDVDGGSAVAAQTVEDGKTVTKPANPTKAENTFANWYRDAAKTALWNFGTDVVVADTTLYAKWVSGENAQPHKVTFDADGGAPVPAEQSVFAGEPVQVPEKPARAGHIFDGWYKADGTTKWNFGTDTVTGAITLKAKWIEAVTVTFNTNGGSDIAPLTVAKDSNVNLYNYQPTRSGYIFDGWYKDEALTQLASYLSDVNANITLYAKWTSTSALAGYEGVWRRESTNTVEAYLLQEDGTAWYFYAYSSSDSSSFSFSRDTWSTSQVDGIPVTFNTTKTEFTTAWDATFTKNTATTKTPAAATGDLLGVWVDGSRLIELKANGDAVFTRHDDTITLKQCADANVLYLLQPETNLVIFSIGTKGGELDALSKQATDPSLAGIWKLTEGGQDYYWTLNANGSGTFHTLGASVPVSFTVTEDKEIDGNDYEVTGSTLTLPDAGWDNETDKSFDLELTKVASVPAGSGADGDSRLHGTWKMTQGTETITVTINSNGTIEQSYSGGSESYIWKADGSVFYTYEPFLDSGRVYYQDYTVSGSTLTISYDGDDEQVLTKQ